MSNRTKLTDRCLVILDDLDNERPFGGSGFRDGTSWGIESMVKAAADGAGGTTCICVID